MITIIFDGHREKQEEGLLRRLEAVLQPGFTGYEISRGPGPKTTALEKKIAAREASAAPRAASPRSSSPKKSSAPRSAKKGK